MSLISLSPNASGTGVFTVASPNSNVDRVLTLPDESGTVDTLQRSGNIIQVVNTTYTGTFSQTISSNTKINNVQASITPTSTSSKILIMCHVFFEGDTSDHDFGWFLYRDSTLLRAPPDGSRIPVIAMAGQGYFDNNSDSTPTTVAIHYFDTPNTTSEITYAPATYHASGTIYINRTVADSNTVVYERGISSITLMEIVG